MISFDIKSCWKSFSAQVQHVRLADLCSHLNHAFMFVSRDILILPPPISNAHTDSQLGLFQWSNSTRNSITHLSFPLMLIYRAG